MQVSTRLGHRDYESALSLVSEAADTSAAQPFELPTVQGLLRMIPAERGGYFEYGGCGSMFGTADTFFVDEPAMSIDVDRWCDTLQACVGTWPLRDSCSASTPQSAPLKISDFLVTRTQLRRNPWYWEVMRPSGIEYEMKLWLPAPEGIGRGFFFVRGPHQHDFGERDRALLQLLRPYLARIRARWESRHRPAALTAREAEVVQLVAQGFTNKEIAARLVISNTTVRTHLENIFFKLGVHTRTAAVAHLLSAASRTLAQAAEREV